MALIRPSALVQTISGALGGAIFKQTRNGLVVAHRPPTIKKVSDRQLANRVQFQALRAYYYHTLTDAQRQQWIDVAPQISYPNRVGRTLYYTPLMLFIAQNMQAAFPGSVNDTPGNLLPGVVCLGLAWACSAGGPYTLSCTDQSNSGGNMTCAFARPMTARPINHSNRWRRPPTKSPPVTPASSRNLYTYFVATWGDPAAGERIGLRMYRHGSRFLPSLTQELWVTVAP